MSAQITARTEADGKVWTLGAAPIGQGGAGRVYRHPVQLDQCFKIYLDGKIAAEHEAKVRAMAANPPDAVYARARDGKPVVQMAWPLDILTRDGAFIGFSMPFIDFNRSHSLTQVIEPALRKRKGVPSHLQYRLRIARNLAVVLSALHQKGHRMIDLKPDNIRVYRWNPSEPQPDSSYVALLDCDGFAVSARPGAPLLPAKLATPELSLPAALAADGGIDIGLLNARAVEQDLWAFAAVAFRLLNEGLSPFDGVPRPGAAGAFAKDERERARALSPATYAFAQAAAGSMVLAPAASIHQGMSPTLRTLFDATFLQKGGVQIDDWVSELDRLLAAEQRCEHHETHWRLGDGCGQCQRDAEQRARPRQPLIRPAPTAPLAPPRPPPAARAAPAPSPLPRAAPQTWPPPAQRRDWRAAIRIATMLGLVTGAAGAGVLWWTWEGAAERWRSPLFWALAGAMAALTALSFAVAPKTLVRGRDTLGRRLAALGLAGFGHATMAGFVLAAGLAVVTIGKASRLPAADAAGAGAFALAPVPPETETHTARWPTVDVYDQPGRDGRGVGSTKPGEALGVLRQARVEGETWLEVQLPDGRSAFVQARNVQPISQHRRALPPQPAQPTQ